MNLELTEDQEFFRDTVRKFLENELPLTVVRELYESADGFERPWWGRAAELGWTSMFVPETAGGGSLSGRPAADAVIVAEEMGRLIAPGPFLPTTVVAAAISWSGSADAHAALLGEVLAGEAIVTWALGEPGAAWGGEGVQTTATADGDSVVITGEKAYVESAGTADHFLVTARTGSGLSQVLVPASAAGVTVVRGRSVDMTRRFGRVSFSGARVPQSAVLGSLGGADATVARQLQLAVALQCAELVGVADRTLEFTLGYGQERFAFGRPILSFQALKHRIADMTVWMEGSKAVTDSLAAAIDANDPEALRLAHVAKAYVGEHCPDVVDDCVQITGGIGVTWEHDIHLYNRRAIVDRAVYGTPEEHKQALVALLDQAGRGRR